jgi:hypothetical protein
LPGLLLLLLIDHAGFLPALELHYFIGMACTFINVDQEGTVCIVFVNALFGGCS